MSTRNPVNLTAERIEAQISAEYFTTLDNAFRGSPVHPRMAVVTLCCLVLKNGFVVTGESSVVDDASFDPVIGQRIARKKAVDKVFELEAYSLRTVISAFEASHPVDVTSTVSADVVRRARAAHEINRAYCAGIGDDSQAAWDYAPQWQRDSAIAGVLKALEGATPEELHQSWLDAKAADGWTYGPVKDAEAKTHPCFVSYAQLPAEQRVKDHLFRAAAAL